jgi:hypothetical protein
MTTTKGGTPALVDAVHTVRTVHRDERDRITRVDEVAAPERAIPLSMLLGPIRELAEGNVIPASQFAERLQAALDTVIAELTTRKVLVPAASIPTAIDAWLEQHAKPLPEPERGELAIDYFTRTRAMVRDGHFTAHVFDLPRSYWDSNDEKEGTQT